MHYPGNWDQDLSDLTEHLLAAALAIDLYQFAVQQHAPFLAHYPKEAASALLRRYSDRLWQGSADLKTFSSVLLEVGAPSP